MLFVEHIIVDKKDYRQTRSHQKEMAYGTFGALILSTTSTSSRQIKTNNVCDVRRRAQRTVAVTIIRSFPYLP